MSDVLSVLRGHFLKVSKLIAASNATPYFIAWTVLALGRSWHVRLVGEERMKGVYLSGHRPIYAFWHGRLLPLSFCFRRLGIYVMSSESRDGRISIKANKFLGYKIIGGSTSHGGMRGLREITRVGRSGETIGITPDGPRGPAQKLHDGLLMIAMATGNPLVPVTASASKRLLLKSWDRFLVPMPFSTVQVNVGKPIHVPRRLDRKEREEFRLYVEDALTRLQDETDRMMGHDAVPTV